ncbi:MAG: phosphate acyltransferase [Actinomycetota bacterium]|jgi:glycerol-3-phosphate acyltransferase PlsX|nr:phosphate--acyl-ACP acyltransferase [Euzebyaceae bacterium]MDQ3451319.1 phosphate acyltransferase [Actinomycetota bacterium]
MRVALDAMGGDHAPTATVAGALLAADAGLDVVLVGTPDMLTAELQRAGAAGRLPIAAADEVVGMHEAVMALRNKRTASVRVAAGLVASGQADAMVSAGSTGATLVAALLSLGRVRGVRRPVLAAVLPTPAGDVVLADAGGSPDPRPEALVAYARMATAYAQARGCAAPSVGLLNVGSEAGKGTALVRHAFTLLHGSDGFVGNVEPAAVLAARADVVITDGFTGNVFLKTLEAMAGDSGDTAGAAVLLGVAGEVLVAHGAADASAVAAAVRTAAAVAGAGLWRRVERHLSA